MSLSRRSFLKKLIIGGAGVAILPWLPTVPAYAARWSREISGRLTVTNAHTGEFLSIRYLTKNGKWVPGAFSKLTYLFRCHYDNEVMPIDPGLFLLMDRLHTRLGAGRQPFELISGYRSPEYNQLLMDRGSAVASTSYHLKGMAADIQIPGIRLKRLRDEAKRIRAGGVGLYPGFVHVDVGPVRFW